jgi:hypothetical protein
MSNGIAWASEKNLKEASRAANKAAKLAVN